MAAFMPGLELNRLFFAEVVQSLLAARFPDVRYSAALIGYGSDVLGYDTPLSRDHEWGPRLLLFLDDETYQTAQTPIDSMLRRELPPTFRGYSTGFSAPKPGDRVRSLADGVAGAIDHHIQFYTLSGFMRHELGVEPHAPLTARDWLTFPEQRLLEVTAGAVYHDGLDALIPLRQRLAYYPHDVWLYRMTAQWRRIAEEEAFVGRCGDVGDDLGSRMVAARLARDVMRLCFLQERRYAPYSKWLGTALQTLACAGAVGPPLASALAAPDWRSRERHLGEAYEAVARMHNALGVTEPQESMPRPYYDRPYQVIAAERFSSALTQGIHDPEILRFVADAGLPGAVDQFVDEVGILQHAQRSRRLGAVLDG